MTIQVPPWARPATICAIACAVSGCSRSDDKKPNAAASGPAPSAQAASAASAPAASVAATTPTPRSVPGARVLRLPSGPVLEILPGQGVGAIRLGATVSTIERLMGKPCEFKTAEACRYVARAVEFFLDDKGATKEIRIHRVDRPTTPEGRTFGVFNGRMRNGLTLMMIPSGVEGLIGKPQKVEQVADGGPAHTVEIDYYDGMHIEYDELPDGKRVVGAIVITKGGGKASPPDRGHTTAR